MIGATVPDTVIEVQTTKCKKLSLKKTQSSTVEEETSKSCAKSDTKVIVDKQPVQVPKTNSIKDMYKNLIGFFKK